MADFRAKCVSFCRRWLDRYWAGRRTYSLRGSFELKRKRVQTLRERIADEFPFEHLPQCPFSSASLETCEQTIVAVRDRYGFPIRLALCHRTGLLYLVDRLTQNGYERFYREGLYRKLTASFHGSRLNDLVRDQHQQAKTNADLVINALRDQISLPLGAALLDVGGSTGALAQAFVQAYEVRATVLDPAKEELEQAAALGLRTKLGLFERVDFADGEKYDVIVLNQMIEHIVDIRATFQKVLSLLKVDGHVVFDILDFLAVVETAGCVEAASRLDHCYFLYDEMVDVLCKRVGLVVVKRFRHMGTSILYYCRPSAPDPHATFSEERLIRVMRRLLDQDTLWAKTPLVLRYPLDERLARRVKGMLS
jgi:SAM-dependent methyltransferase